MSSTVYSSPISRPNTRFSSTGRKNEWPNRKDESCLEKSPSPYRESSPGDSTVNSTFLQTLNLKSKEKTTSNGNIGLNSGTFLSEDSFNSSPLCKYERKINEKDSSIETLLESPVSLLPTSAIQPSKENQDSLGKTLAFSLQLIAAGDENIIPQSPCMSDMHDSSPKTFPLKEQNNETNLYSEEEPIELKEENTPVRGRYRTRSSFSNADNQSRLSNSCKDDDNTSNNASQDLIVNDISDFTPTVNQETSEQGEEVQPIVTKKRGRRKKETDKYSVQKGNIFLCSQCGKSFNKRQTLRQHFITHTDRFACSFCNVRCKSKGDLRSHTQTHTKEKPYRCEVCNTSYTRESILKKHKSTQLHKNACFQLGNQIHLALKGDLSFSEGKDSKRGKFSCSECPKKFESRLILRQHVKVHFYKYSCPQCHKRCKTSHALRVHKRCHLKRGIIPCKFCSRGFCNLRLLRDHIKAAHSFLFWQSKFPGNMWKTLLTQKVECFDDLKVEFFQSFNNSGKLVCSVCSRNFKSKKAFQKHCEKHDLNMNNCATSTNDKSLVDQTTGRNMSQYQCAECIKSFIYFDEYCKHHSEYHSGKLLTCHVCYNQFDSTKAFKNHIQNHGPTMLFSGASLEESKVPHTQNRYHSLPADQFSISSKDQEEKHSKKIMNNTRLLDGSDDESLLESRELTQLLSAVLNNYSDKEEEVYSDEEEDLYSGLRVLLFDSTNQASVSTSEKADSGTKQDNRVYKKYETDMKIFSVEDHKSNFYRCTLCDTVFVSSDQLQDHMKSHICIHCDVFCQSKEDLAEHFHCLEKLVVKSEVEKPDLDEMSDARSDDMAFSSDEEMNEVFLDEMEGILDYESKNASSMDFLSTFSHDEIIRTNKKIFERYSCIDVPTNIYACIICKRKYARPTTLTRHFKTHVCHYCNTFFIDKSDLTEHKYKHRKKAAMIKAEISGDSTAKILHSPMVSKVNRELFKKFTVIDSNRNVNKCCLCDKLFVRKTVLTRHMKTHICSYCDKFFEDKYELARHLSLHKMDSRISQDETHQRSYSVFDEEKPFIASSTFSNQLEDDGKMVNIGSSFSSTLPQFTTTFSAPNTNANETVTFIQIPVAENCTDPNTVPFDPNVVAEAPTYQIISDPIVQNQASYMVGPQTCHEDNSNKILALAQDHMVTPDQCPVGTTDLFECNTCSKTFFKSGHLKSHISTHAAPGPFACRFCGKTFIRNGPLRKHEKTHETKRCEPCDLSFTCQYELDHHMQIHESYPFYK